MVKSADELPEVLITDILIRLSVKSLVRCKFVCKSWLSIISNPYFIKSHLQRAIIASMQKPSLLKIQYPPPSQQHKLDASTLAMLSSYPINYECLDMPSVFKSPGIVNSCNGIICLCEHSSRSRAIFLWNPSIRQYKRLPYHPCQVKSTPFTMGFGYDSRSNDYKVFRVVYENFYDEVPTVQVYSTKADTWRDFRAPVLKNKDYWRSRISSTNTLVKEVVYIDGGDELISFDFRTEVCGKISFPCSAKQASRLLDFEDCVAMAFVSDGSRTGVDLWVLDDACIEVSWTKKFVIEADFGMNNFWLYCYLGAGLLSGRRNGNIFVYDCDEKKEKKYSVLKGLNGFETLKYTESLVSLDGFGQLE